MSVLAERYSGMPFGSVRALYPDGSGIPEVQITNPAGGVLGGDRLDLGVDLAPGAQATVTTQGATKAYRGTESRQDAEFRVGDGAFLEYLPHHLIPYPGSSHRQRTGFHLRGGARLLAWEACSAGRLARGERFVFGRLSSRTRVCVDGSPVAADGFELTGDGSIAEPFGGYSYLGTVFAVLPGAPGLADTLHLLLQEVSGVLASASAPLGTLCVVRMLAGSAPALYRAMGLCRGAAREHLALPAGRGVW